MISNGILFILEELAYSYLQTLQTHHEDIEGPRLLISVNIKKENKKVLGRTTRVLPNDLTECALI